MKKLVLMIIGLLAVFTIIRVQSEENTGRGRLTIHPGYFELGGGEERVAFSFGFMDVRGKEVKQWDIFPMSVSVRTKKASIGISFSGFNFLTRSGVTIGKQIIVKGTRKGDILSVGGDVLVEGKVEGDVWTFGADISLKKGAVITGNAVAIGGKIVKDKKARILGNRDALENIKLPFISFLASGKSAVKIRMMIELFRIVLFLLLLFFFVHFWSDSLGKMLPLTFGRWKENILYILFAAFLVPLFIILLLLSIVGIFFLPFFILVFLVSVYAGAVVVMVRIGIGLLGGGPTEGMPSNGRIYLGGLVGYLIIEIPFLLGLVLDLASSKGFITVVGVFLKATGVVLWIITALYGTGVVLSHLRYRNEASGV